MIYDTKQLLNKLRNRDISNDSAFEVLKALCALANKYQDNYEPIVQELVLRALDQQNSFDPYGEILAGLVRKLGLYPYLSIEHLSMQDAVAREFHRPANISPARSVKTRTEYDTGDRRRLGFSSSTS